MKGRIAETENRDLKIDNTDRRIIYALSENSRVPLTTLAKKLKISRDVLNYRISKLIENKVILRFAPHIDLTFFGYNTFQVLFILNDADKVKRNAFLQELVNHENTKAVMEYSTKWEMSWTVVAKSVREYDRILTNISTKYSDIIIEKIGLEVIKGFKSLTLPQRPDFESLSWEPKKRDDSFKPDETDLNILKILAENCRTSSYEIAEMVGVSAITARNRIKRLVNAGVIRKFSILVDLNAMNYHLYSLGVVVKSLDESSERKLEEFLRGQRFMIRAIKVLGPWDLMMTVVSDNIRNFHSTVKEFTDTFVDVIINYESLIAYTEHNYTFLPTVVSI